MASLVELRVATDVDLPQLSAVFRRASLSNDGDGAALLAHPDALRFTGEGIATGRTWVAVTDAGEITGFATWLPVDSELAELEDLFVEPAWMRRGVATRLVEKLKALLARSDFTRLEVTANPHADAFYRSVGFAPVGIIDTEFGAGTRMELALTAHDPAATPEPAAQARARGGSFAEHGRGAREGPKTDAVKC